MVYANVDSKHLSELSHDSAYKAVCERMTDDPQKDVLTLIDIARAGGASDAMIDHIRQVQIIKEALNSYKYRTKYYPNTIFLRKTWKLQ